MESEDSIIPKMEDTRLPWIPPITPVLYKNFNFFKYVPRFSHSLYARPTIGSMDSRKQWL